MDNQPIFRARLMAAGVRQRQLAKALGVDITTVNRWCVGRVTAPAYAWAWLDLYERLPSVTRLRYAEDHGWT